MNIREATQQYESWLEAHIPLLADDLELKHQLMRGSAFAFLRATFYRWAQLFPELCGELMAAPVVLGVGDLHVDNFGTWRDREGRLIWGINDFDEVCRLPYTSDLVRLSASAHLAIEHHELEISNADACKEILEGYRDSLQRGGRPFVLAEHNAHLRGLAVERLKNPEKFWMDLIALLPAEEVPGSAKKALMKLLPKSLPSVKFLRRTGGIGSRGRRRFVAGGTWHGGLVAREAKELAPSAWEFAWPPETTAGILYQDLLDSAVRCADPFVRVKRGWIVRRLAPDCSRIDLASLERKRDTAKLLRAMGAETANVHLGSQDKVILLADLQLRGKDRPDHEWLHHASRTMRESVRAEWREWNLGFIA